jgi:Arc/MetJ-type ribon-helix-helix transcriptional regulator
MVLNNNCSRRSDWLAKKKKNGKPSQGLKEVLIKELSPLDSDTKRDVPVMTRLATKHVNMLDLLVKLGIFKSRSEVAAAIIEKTLSEQIETFELLNNQIIRLEEIQDTAKNIALNVFKG